MRSARFKTGPTEHLGELTGKAETLNFTQRKVCEANQHPELMNNGETEQSRFSGASERRGIEVIHTARKHRVCESTFSFRVRDVLL